MQFINAGRQRNVIGEFPIAPMLEKHWIARPRDRSAGALPSSAIVRIFVGSPYVAGAIYLRFPAVAGKNAQGHLRTGRAISGSYRGCSGNLRDLASLSCALPLDNGIGDEA